MAPDPRGSADARGGEAAREHPRGRANPRDPGWAPSRSAAHLAGLLLLLLLLLLLGGELRLVLVLVPLDAFGHGCLLGSQGYTVLPSSSRLRAFAPSRLRVLSPHGGGRVGTGPDDTGHGGIGAGWRTT